MFLSENRLNTGEMDLIFHCLYFVCFGQTYYIHEPGDAWPAWQTVLGGKLAGGKISVIIKASVCVIPPQPSSFSG